jgi:hypothetical protein
VPKRTCRLVLIIRKMSKIINKIGIYIGEIAKDGSLKRPGESF